MIYLDTSVLLAQCLAEDTKPPASLWEQPLVSSRLTEYETFVRVHERGLGDSHGEHARQLLSRVSMLELTPPVLERALEPFPVPLRTMDALHLASIEFLRSRRVAVSVATYDRRMIEAAEALGIEVELL